jgi:hypothetical protein
MKQKETFTFIFYYYYYVSYGGGGCSSIRNNIRSSSSIFCLIEQYIYMFVRIRNFSKARWVI